MLKCNKNEFRMSYGYPKVTSRLRYDSLMIQAFKRSQIQDLLAEKVPRIEQGSLSFERQPVIIWGVNTAGRTSVLLMK